MGKRKARWLRFGVKQYSTDLSLSQWQRISSLLKVQRKSKWELQRIVEAIFYVCKNGCVWRDLPHDFPAWQTVYWYFQKWGRDGTWDLVSAEMTLSSRVGKGKKPCPSVVVIDSQSVKNTVTATQQVGVDGGKLVKGRKRFIITDTLGNLLWTQVTAANCYDGTTAAKFWSVAAQRQPLLDEVRKVFADRTFGGTFNSEMSRQHGVKVEIPGVPIAQKGAVTITHIRWVVERSFAWIGNNRRLSKDFERKTDSSEHFIHIAHIRRVLKPKPPD